MAGLRRPSSRAHRLIHFIYVQLVAQEMQRSDLCRRAGVGEAALEKWWTGAYPNLANLEAVLEVLGYGVKATPLADQSVSVPRSSTAVGGKRLEEDTASRGRRAKDARRT